MNYKLLMNFALETGEIMLENGAETLGWKTRSAEYLTPVIVKQLKLS